MSKVKKQENEAIEECYFKLPLVIYIAIFNLYRDQGGVYLSCSAYNIGEVYKQEKKGSKILRALEQKEIVVNLL